jgi:hypothetical protein
MAIFICNHCNHIQETPDNYIGKQAKCPKCRKASLVHNTTNYIKSLTEQYLLQSNQLTELKIELQKTVVQEEKNDLLKVEGIDLINKINIHNTDYFSQKKHYSPIINWFNNQNIDAVIDPDMMNTTGFFDEAAIKIGDKFSTIGSIVNQIKYIQNKNYDTVKISLSKKTDKEIERITDFCQMLYDYSLVKRYTFIKKDKVIYLNLQDIPKVKNFFNGIWMEWFVLIKLFELFTSRNIAPAIARSVKISFSKNETNELDVFLINNNKPICIECKTGEFRQDLSKYFSLRKKLKLPKENFILCVFGLNDEQAIGLTSMYDITVVNESTLLEHIENTL